MAVELECKVRVVSHEAVREKLRAAGAQYLGRVVEENRLFDDHDGRLITAGSGLRVRATRVLDGRDAAATLTYKGPPAPSAFKRREEVEVQISDPKAVTHILHALGFRERIIFEKRRESWLLPPCRVELDELPKFGSFVEVEGPDEDAIRLALATLGATDGEHVAESYAAIAAGSARAGQTPPIHLRFEK